MMMRPITNEQIDRYKYILMYDDETVLDAIIAWRDSQGFDWWYLVVDREPGGYAIARYSDLLNAVEEPDEAFLLQPLSNLVGGILEEVFVVVERNEATYEKVRELVERQGGQAALIHEEGDLRGVLTFGGTRSAKMRGGVFDSKLLKLAGEKYAEIPPGAYSPRRAKAMREKKRRR
jgi:hypothetical protein